MKKKLQVFISSTYTDLIEERQAAVQAVLSAGHIPAGMELFKSGDESQKETIKKWIDESDVYLLLLGGRYGTIEPSSQKSYTHWEYDYAESVNIPRFAIVAQEEALEEKIKKMKSKEVEVYEYNNVEKFNEFKKLVLSKTSEFYEDVKDIKYIIIKKLVEYTGDEKLKGWISGREIKGNEDVIIRFEKLLEENDELKKINQKMIADLNQLKKEKIKNDGESVEKESLSIRIEKIFRVLDLQDMDNNDYIEWHLYNENDNGTYYQLTLPIPDNKFIPYFKFNENHKAIVEELIFFAILNERNKANDVMTEIRLMLSEYGRYTEALSGLKIKFLLAIEGNQNEFKEKAIKYFEDALSVSNVGNGNEYILEIWDGTVIRKIEEDLKLNFK